MNVEIKINNKDKNSYLYTMEYVNKINNIEPAYNRKELSDFIRHNIHSFYTLKILEWEYFSHKCQSVIKIVVDSENKILGTIGFIPIDITDGSQIIPSCKTESVFFHESLRGSGMFKKTHKIGVDEVFQQKNNLVWAFTKLTKLWENKLEFNTCDDLFESGQITLSKLRKIRNLLNESRTSWYNQFLKSTLILFRNGYTKKSAELEFIPLGKNDLPEFTNLIKRIFQTNFTKSKQKQFYIDYNDDYLTWRFINNPVLTYQFFIINTQTGNNCACGILNLTDKKNAVLTELVYDSNSSIKNILISICNYLLENKFTDLEFHGNKYNQSIGKVLSTIVLLGGRSKTNPYIKWVYKFKNENTLFMPQNWHITGSWTEGFRI